MRIGEIRNILQQVINGSFQIVVESNPVYAGQAYQITNYDKLIEALNILSEQEWNDLDSTSIDNIKSKHKLQSSVTLTVDEFNQLTAYVNAINLKLPLYFQVVNSLTKNQDEKTINVKLPQIQTLSELSEFNKRLDDILKLFNIDGKYEVEGFDKGTEWYVLVITGGATGILSYNSILACLKIAQEYFKARTEYFKSQEAKISYEASLTEKGTKSDKGFEQYKEKWLELFIKEKVTDFLEQIETNGHTKPELQVKLVMGTNKIIAELDKGTEIHLSLNPPSYVEEKNGKLEIDYNSLKQYLPLKTEEIKAIKSSQDNVAKTQNEI